MDCAHVLSDILEQRFTSILNFCIQYATYFNFTSVDLLMTSDDLKMLSNESLIWVNSEPRGDSR